MRTARRHWIPPGGLVASVLAQGTSWVLLLVLATRRPPVLDLRAFAWLHLVALGWLTMAALSILVHVIPTFTDVPLRGEGTARGALFAYGLGVAALVLSFWNHALWALPWAGMLVLSALLVYAIPAARTLSAAFAQSRVEAPIARALALTLSCLLVTAALGVVLSWGVAGRPVAFAAGVLPVHAALGIVGWLTLLVMGVSTRTVRPISGARSRFSSAHFGSGAAVIIGLCLLIASVFLRSPLLALVSAAAMCIGAVIYVFDLSDVLRRATVQHRPPQAFVWTSGLSLLAGLALATTALAGLPTGAAAVYVLLVGWLGGMVNGHLLHIGIRLLATMVRGDDDETRPGELLAAPLSWSSFGLFATAVIAGGVALTLRTSALLQLAALCGLTGWIATLVNVAFARHRAKANIRRPLFERLFLAAVHPEVAGGE